MGKFESEVKVGQYKRIGQYTLAEVLPFVELSNRNDKVKRDYDGHMVKMGSQRYQLFATKGVTCVECGIEGIYFGLERIDNKNQNMERISYHFNLYGLRNGKEVLITKDHIVPKSKGGKNHLINYQVMCFDCNLEKADTLTINNK